MKNTYIEFGFNKTLRKIKGSDAYNLWHIAVRVKEKVFINDLINSKKYNLKDLPRLEKFLSTYIFFVLSKKKTLLELGSSVMEISDGIIYLKNWFKKKIPNKSKFLLKKKVNFIGIENYKYFRILSKVFNDYHKKKGFFEKINLFDDIKKIDKVNLRNNFFHDMAVSNYVFKRSLDFFNFLNRFDSGYFKLFYTSENRDIKIKLAGGNATVFALNNLKKKLNKKLFLVKKSSKLFLANNSKNKKIQSGFFYYGNIDTYNDYNYIKKYLVKSRFINTEF